MDDSSNPPPIPHRPGRAVKVQSIDSIKTESTPNEYVDTTTIAGAIHTPQRPPKPFKTEKAASLKSHAHFTKNIEQHENIRNELREQLQDVRKLQSTSVKTVGSHSQSPEIPPRTSRPPPLPPRDHKGVCTTRLRNTPEKHVSLQCNPSSQRANRNTNSKSPLPATVLIITEEPNFLQFPASRLNRNHKLPKDVVSPSSRAVTQQPTTSNVTLTLGETGTISNTIICPECGQCRCSDCTSNRKLPERWLCEGNCRCSADSIVDTLSCMWCVKGCFKTITNSPDGSRINPCACTESPKCLLRWTALAALSLCLPCLCCYGPMQLGVAAATACYNCCRKRGCDCEEK